MGMELKRGGTLGTEAPTRNRGSWIAFNRNQFPMLVIDDLATTDTAVRANRGSSLGICSLGPKSSRSFRHGFDSCAVGPVTKLAQQRPVFKQLEELHFPGLDSEARPAPQCARHIISNPAIRL